MDDYTTDLFYGLNAAQQQAVAHINGPLLILAGPGSGKTRVITHRIAHMIKQGVSPRAILGLTFTNKAAQEMRSRVNRLVGKCDHVSVSTFHSFGVGLLRHYARYLGLSENFSIYDTDDSLAALKTAVAISQVELTHLSLGKIAERISHFKNILVSPEVLQAEALSSEEYQVARVYPHYQSLLQRANAVDFDDILFYSATLLRENPELRRQLDERFQYVMVDEYQDTNIAQYVIVRHLSIDYPNLAATGDPDQSIYGWRGANLKNIRYLERDYPGLAVVRLEENYRSTPQILSVADCLIQHNEIRKSKTLIPTLPSGFPVRLAIYPTARHEAEDIADEILAGVSQGEYEYGDISILYRAMSHSRLVEQALMRRGIPYQLIGGVRFYLRREIKDLIAYLLLVHNPDDDVALKRIINVPPRGIGKKTMEQLVSIAEADGCSLLDVCRQTHSISYVSARARKAISQFVELYEKLVELGAGSLSDLLQGACELTGYREYLECQMADDDGQTNVFDNLDELLAEAHELDDLDGADRSALEVFLEGVALYADTDRLKLGADVVTVMTLHASKGLEFPCVYIPAIEENILPHIRCKDDPLGIEEERRLLFVGMTRAQARLHLSFAKSRGLAGYSGSGVPSSFLMQLPREEMQLRDFTDVADFDVAHDSERGVDESSYDEWSQLTSEPEFDRESEYDDTCQLPEEEIRSRLGRNRQKPSLKIPSASGFSPGSLVEHARFGRGRVFKVSGNGAKKTITIDFEHDGSQRTFLIAHASLTILHS
ncbi:MAG: UvrD-helicase domain-containing protein [Planctomycetales bacterium]|nr:UvrD-helicase domain-containing protein [Planctomycetales bacterium]